MSLQAIKYQRGFLEVLDQLKLPSESVYIKVNNVQDGWEVIRSMKVRGAPAIAIVGCLSLAVELGKTTFITKEDLKKQIEEKLSFLVTARPTAVNIKVAAEELTNLVSTLYKDDTINVDGFKQRFIKAIEVMLGKDVSDNKLIGKFGSEAILNGVTENVSILTHCNTGSLATAGYGTALGVIRALQEAGRLDHVYCTETRPYNQGARLTAYELVYEKIPSTLIVDSMVAALMKSKKISAVIVGADRVVSNGDTANKIGTYQIAIIAKYFDVPFYVAATITSIDMTLASGEEIKIEERPQDELTYIGSVRIAAPGINCWNPAFDVTPASLITAIINEKGVIPPHKLKELF